MKKLWKSFKILILFLIFPINSYSIELNEYGLNVNNFSELKELRTIYIADEDGLLISLPEETDSLSKIKDFRLNNNFLSSEEDTVYQYCCNSKKDLGLIMVGKINGAEEKFKTLTPKAVLDLDNQIKVKNALVFEKGKLVKSFYIKDDKYNLLEIDNEKQTYLLHFNSPLKFKDTFESLPKINFNNLSPADFELELEFTPNYIDLLDISSGVSILRIPTLSITIVADDKSGKIIYTDENLKQVKYHGNFVENADLQNPSSFLNPTLLNFLPTEFKKILDKGREINSNYSLNYTLEELKDLIRNSEKLISDNANFAKQKENELKSVIQKKQAELKAEEDRIKAEELKAAKLEEEKAEEERIKIFRQEVEEDNKRRQAEQAAAEAKEKTQKYIQYGLIILLIGGLIAFIFLTNFLDNLKKFLKQLSGIFKNKQKKVRKSYLPDNLQKNNKTNKKKLGNWIADWANGYEDPRSAYHIVLAVLCVSILLFFTIPQYDYENETTDAIMQWIFGLSFFVIAPISGYLTYKIYAGIKTYNCPKCKRIYAGEIYSQTHLGSKQRAKTYRVRDNRTVRYKDYRGQSQTDNYTVERDESGVEQLDFYHNKVKCKLCSHKWEYDSSTSTRVA